MQFTELEYDCLQNWCSQQCSKKVQDGDLKSQAHRVVSQVVHIKLNVSY